MEDAVIRKHQMSCLLWAVVTTAALCNTAHAAWFSDDFDSYSTGSLAGKGGWNGSSAVRVQNTFARSGKAIEADYLTWGAGDVSHSISGSGGYYCVDFDAAMDTDGAAKGENLGYVKIFNSSGGEITRVYFAHQRFKILLGPANPTVIKDDVAARTWYHIRVGVNTANNTLDAWVDGVQVVFQGLAYGTPSAISSVTFGQWSSLGGKFTKSETYLDNLVIDGGAPPYQSASKILSPRFFPGFECQHVCYPYVFYDASAGHYKMYYAGSSTVEINESLFDQWMTGVATSTDTLTWTRKEDDYQPVIRAHKFLEGELVDPDVTSGEFDSIMAIGACVLKDDSTYKAWYTGWGGEFEHVGGGICNKINYRIGYATSPDGINWTKHVGSAGAGSVLGLGPPGSPDAKGVGQPHILKEGSTYRMWYEGFDGSIWRILYATSNDGVTWTRRGTALNPGTGSDPDALGCRNPVVITRNGHYELWYQGQSGSEPNYHVLRATSSDGLTWTKAGEVALHPDDSLDGSERIHVDSIIVQADNSCRVFFAKENTTVRNLVYGTVYDKNFHIYTEVVNP